jgi:hypothetical protein
MLVSLQGCGISHRRYSAISKDYRYKEYVNKTNNIFSSTKYDLKGLDSLFNTSTSDFLGLRPIAFTIGVPILILDIPISIIGDIICSPYDIYDLLKKKKIKSFWDKAIIENDYLISLYDDTKYIIPNINFYLPKKIMNENISNEFLDKLIVSILYKEDCFVDYYDLIESIISHKNLKSETLEKIAFATKDSHLKLRIYNNINADKNLREKIIASFNRSNYPRHSNQNVGLLFPAQHKSFTSEELLVLVEKYKNNDYFLMDVLRNQKSNSNMIEIMYREWKNEKLKGATSLIDDIASNEKTSEGILLEIVSNHKQYFRPNSNIFFDISQNKQLSPRLISKVIMELVNEEYYSYNMNTNTHILRGFLEDKILSQKDKKMIFNLTTKHKYFKEKSEYTYRDFLKYRQWLLYALQEDHNKK